MAIPDKDKKKDLSKDEAPPIVLIPSSIFKGRDLSVLESLVEYLHFKENKTLHEIAVLLNRDDRTIWTVLSRVKKKRGGKQ
ncbi:MAG TPA: hypothetical protein VJB12_02895 [Candidatus Nanoarchaeia archaeon]|nr:hypothetical protein [Candidatus Nanoarchaeia archaeon]